MRALRVMKRQASVANRQGLHMSGRDAEVIKVRVPGEGKGGEGG